jgi:hypothetical protein
VPTNPFSPAFGSEPAYLAGREAIVADFLEGLAGGVGDPNRSTILIGPRGSGKTALINHIATAASAQGWVSARVTALPGMLEAVIEQALEAGEHLLPAPAGAKLTGLGAFGVTVNMDRPEARSASWRSQVARIVDALGELGSGLLITVDEVDAKQAELVRLVADYQHFVSEGRAVALLMAGLPGKVLQMFTHRSISFVRRAFQHRLDPLSQADARLALRVPIESAGRSIEPKALDAAAAFSRGFPFLIQMVGYQTWRQHPGREVISAQDAADGIRASQESMDAMILDTTVQELSKGDLEFLTAMKDDPDFSTIADLAARLRISPSSAGQRRIRLIKAGVIEEYGRGQVRFTLPLLREYLQRAE